jgi:hypothetical protein
MRSFIFFISVVLTMGSAHPWAELQPTDSKGATTATDWSLVPSPTTNSQDTSFHELLARATPALTSSDTVATATVDSSSAPSNGTGTDVGSKVESIWNHHKEAISIGAVVGSVVVLGLLIICCCFRKALHSLRDRCCCGGRRREEEAYHAMAPVHMSAAAAHMSAAAVYSGPVPHGKHHHHHHGHH